MTSRLSRTILPLLAASATALTAPSVAGATDLIVRYKPGTDAAERADARSGAGVVRQEDLPVSGMELVAARPGTTAAEAIAELQSSDDVLYAQADMPRHIARTPKDANYALQWALPKIGAPAAWDITIGDPTMPVAVVDTGVDATHPDLKPNIWTNSGEIPGDGLDNDGNGYADDVHGWDFVGAGDADPSDEDPQGHGTHVAGTIGARGSDVSNTGGTVGVGWETPVIPLRVLGANGTGSTLGLIKAYAYAQLKGARIVNLSLSGPDYDQAEYDAMRAAKDVLFVVAAGNAGGDNDIAANNSYPCEYDLPNIVCVAATDSTDAKAVFSNYGATTVDLAAPGVDILSTRKGGGWVRMNGTSMAAPHVAGAAALLLSERPQLTPWQAGQVLIGGVDPVAGLEKKMVSGGRLNLARTLAAPTPSATQPAATDPTPAPVIVPVTPAPPTGTTTTPPATTTTPSTPPTSVPAPVAPAPSAPATPAAPAPAPLAGAISAVDRTAPALRISLSSRVALRTALAGRLRPRAGTSERSTIRLRLSIDQRVAKRLRIPRSIGSGSIMLTGAGSKAVTVRLTSKARRALARARNVKATLSATATDAAGNRSSMSRRLTLR
jgi:subtilisin family serine protease